MTRTQARCSTDLLDVVVGEGTAIFELLSCENQTLLIWGDSFLLLDLSLDNINAVRGLDLEGNGFTRKGFDENLHDFYQQLSKNASEGEEKSVKKES